MGQIKDCIFHCLRTLKKKKNTHTKKQAMIAEED